MSDEIRREEARIRESLVYEMACAQRWSMIVKVHDALCHVRLMADQLCKEESPQNAAEHRKQEPHCGGDHV